MKAEKDAADLCTGCSDEVTGISKSNVDAIKLQIDSVIGTGISPKLIGHHVEEIPVNGKNSAILIRIPRSWTGPHAVTHKGSFKFYSRNSAGKFELDVGQLREAFLNRYALEDEIKRFTLERAAKIAGNDCPLPLEEGPLTIVHLIPLDRTQSLDVLKIRDDPSKCRLIYSTVIHSCRPNIDGLFFHNKAVNGNINSYIQIYRDGIVEGVVAGLMVGSTEDIAPITLVEDRIIGFYRHYLDVYRHFEITGPYLCAIRMHGVKGIKIGANRSGDVGEFTIDRDSLVLPDIQIEQDSDTMEEVLKPALDILWQSAGRDGSASYDVDGKWIRNDRNFG